MNDPEIQAAMLPSLCSCLRRELGLADAEPALIIDRACAALGIPLAGSPDRRARACLDALGI
eukprot:311293-Prymnesium_polylepis.1